MRKQWVVDGNNTAGDYLLQQELIIVNTLIVLLNMVFSLFIVFFKNALNNRALTGKLTVWHKI
ncbi:hypothetical protein B9929_16095 [Salmonella enterica]|nr:hypothetical protein [Salmonella enterica]EAP0042686.1 hypothetical protein [Salmonella enterica]EAU0385057.1 hypothetical protein [Salmonella enterica]EAZ4663581.1 hypothetical protein [Salmonella enterica]EBA7872603.1 hypothetical protein [Salmonella enterica]